MKRHPVLLFALFNGLLFAVCAVWYWIPAAGALTADLSTLDLQERRYKIKESNLQNAEANEALLTELQAGLSNGEIDLLPYSELLPELAKIRGLARGHEVLETALHMDEPVLFDTEAKTVVILEVSAAYRGAYENLCALTADMLNLSCNLKELNIVKEESVMTAVYILYGITE